MTSVPACGEVWRSPRSTLVTRRAGEDGAGVLLACRTEGEWPPSWADELAREARAAAAVEHPGLAAVVGVEVEPARVAIQMRVPRGRSLGPRRALGRLEPPMAALLVAAAADALDRAHRAERPCFFGPIDPQHVWLSEAGEPVLLHLGVARIAGAYEGGLRGRGLAITPPMGPDEALGRAVDARTDVYHLAHLFAELVTGREVFDRGDLFSYLEALRSGPRPALHRQVPTIPPAQSDAIQRALAAEPHERPSVPQLRVALLDRPA